MVFNNIYKKYTWKTFSNQYSNNMKDLFSGFVQILYENHKVLLKTDGTIMIDVNNMSPFLIYSGEFFSFLQICTEKLTDNDNISSDDGKRVLANQFNEITRNFKVGSMGLDEDAYHNRPNDYNTALGLSTVRCESADMVCSFDSGKIAAVFTDCVIASEIKKDFCTYDSSFTICKSYDNENYARALLNYAIDVYDTIMKQVTPYIDGTIVSQRKEKGVCPNCGGEFKGLLRKKCEVCGTQKEKQEGTNT